jgi:glycosidase
MKDSRYPVLFQLNTRVHLTALSEEIGQKATLDDIPDADLDQLAELGFEWVWLLSVWQTGNGAMQVSRTQPEWLEEFKHTLPDLTDADIMGSGFAITAYEVHKDLGGKAALQNIRKRLKKRGMKLMLDFVPNHMALDHHWTVDAPDLLIQGNLDLLQKEPKNYFSIGGKGGERIFAYGRDPFFAGWPDTVQLNYANPALQEAMRGELLNIAAQCDGVRCDMAMLVLPDVFQRTWGKTAESFWPVAISSVREKHPDFIFMAEVYWDLEWELQQQGFDYTYDKRLYDRLHEGHATAVRDHFRADPAYQDKMARFLENHDEPRVAATFRSMVHQAAAVLTFFSPGLRFIHQGQLEGRRKKISPHLVRAPVETDNVAIQQFYLKLLEALKLELLRSGNWRLADCVSVWENNNTHLNYIAFTWENASGERLLVVVNYSDTASQCFVKLPFDDLADKAWTFKNLMSDVAYTRDGNDLMSGGLFMDEKPWSYFVFLVAGKPTFAKATAGTVGREIGK